MPRPIYVETFIRGPLDEVWARTQQPELHQQWDLCFSSIPYLPRPEGESVATEVREGVESTSVLKFTSDSPLSLIRTGSGYWKYRPEPGGVRFITGYDYEVRYGALGRLLDRAFRPLIGWATAWSFDCLRLWVERDHSPALLRRLALVQLASKSVLAVCWLYQGLVPKLLFPEGGELDVLKSTHVVPDALAQPALYALGVAEILYGLWFLLRPGSRWLYLSNLLILAGLGLSAGIALPQMLKAPFNTLTISLGMMGLSLTGLLSLAHIPYAWRCKRKPGKP